ncbi:unnamed protein product [Tilletia controversa]|nr:unnamed protein product [Tilletia controversa]
MPCPPSSGLRGLGRDQEHRRLDSPKQLNECQQTVPWPSQRHLRAQRALLDHRQLAGARKYTKTIGADDASKKAQPGKKMAAKSTQAENVVSVTKADVKKEPPDHDPPPIITERIFGAFSCSFILPKAGGRTKFKVSRIGDWLTGDDVDVEGF